MLVAEVVSGFDESMLLSRQHRLYSQPLRRFAFSAYQRADGKNDMKRYAL